MAEAVFLHLAGDERAIEIVSGLRFRPAIGERVMINLVTFEPNTEAPSHTHEEEQVVYIIEGEIVFQVNDEERVLGPGDVVLIPPFVPHGARSLETGCTELDIFSPPRRALVDLLTPPSTQAGGDD